MIFYNDSGTDFIGPVIYTHDYGWSVHWRYNKPSEDDRKDPFFLTSICERVYEAGKKFHRVLGEVIGNIHENPEILETGGES